MRFLLFAFLSAVSPLGGLECISFPTDASEPLKHSDVVFAGTLIKDEYQDRLTFRADRIWKGSLEKSDIVVYVPQRGFVGAYRFLVGDRYLLFAHILSKDERDAMAVPPNEKIAFGIFRPCGSPPPLALTRQLDKIARGRKP